MKLHPMLIALGFGLLGCASPIVGAECAPGYTACDGRCVVVADDPLNCGRCGFVCLDGMCSLGVCPGGGCLDGVCPDAGFDAGLDGALPDGSTDGSVDGSTPDGGDGGAGDGGPVDGGDGGSVDPDLGPLPGCSCDVGERCCDDVCVNPDTAPTDCGACGVTCAAGEVCSAGTCGPVCSMGLTLCGGLCVDTQDDPNNCGSCGNRCASGICIDGMCSVGFPGHIILVGHDYASNRVGQNRVAGNAVFTSFDPEPHVVTFEGTAPTALVRGVDRAIDQVATERSRAWTKIDAAADEVPAELAQAQVFLIYPQGASSDMELFDIARTWTVALDTFTRRGGVVVVFDGESSHSGTWQMLAAAGLLDAGGHTVVTGDELALTGASDTVAFGVPLRYAAESTSVRFDETDGAGVVVSHPDGPVVLHRTVTP